MVAAHVAHGRQPWTTCRRRCTSEQCSSRLRTARTSTPETRGQACWSRTLPVAMQPREGADPSLINQTCSLRDTPACCKFSSLALCILLAQALRAASASLGTASAPFSLVLLTSSELCPRAYILESSPRDKRPGLLVLPSASCHDTLRRSRPKPQQPDLFAPRYVSMLYICQPRALHFTRTAPRAASASLGTASAPFFGASDQLGIMPQGRHTGIETLDIR